MGRIAPRRSLMAVMAGLQDALQALFSQRLQAQGRRRRALQRRVLFGLELLWKIEEQVLLPSLHAAHETQPGQAPPVRDLMQEIDLMRELSALTVQTASGNRDVSMSVLEGLASLHFGRLEAAMAAVDDVLALQAGVDWAAIEAEVQALLGRWRNEVITDGHIEDEEADPVGVAPR